MIVVLTLILIVVLLVGRSRRRAKGPFLVRIRIDDAGRVLVANVRDATATLLSRGGQALEQYELRRADDGSWEQRQTGLPQPETPLLFPTHPLHPPSTTQPSPKDRANADVMTGPYRRAGSEWKPCAELVGERIQEAYQRYENG